jgi:hypothetical protein
MIPGLYGTSGMMPEKIPKKDGEEEVLQRDFQLGFVYNYG